LITIISVGKTHEDWVRIGIERYEKRLKRPFNIEWVLLPHSSREGVEARQDESARILSRLGSSDYVIVLDEIGIMLDSPALSAICETRFVSSERIAIIIGGAYGVTKELRDRAAMVWSLSDLVFPHQLVRLMLVEQIYRAQEIARGSGYHHS